MIDSYKSWGQPHPMAWDGISGNQSIAKLFIGGVSHCVCPDDLTIVA